MPPGAPFHTLTTSPVAVVKLLPNQKSANMNDHGPSETCLGPAEDSKQAAYKGVTSSVWFAALAAA